MKQSSRIEALIIALFFLSGACGLIYEVIWQRMLSLVFGNTTFATATVLASFMLGLALGSFYFGKLADRYKSPLKLYAYLQIGIGIFAVLFPFIIATLTGLYVRISEVLHTTFYLFSLVKFALCFFTLLIPAFLMGGTLPAISKFFVTRMDRLGWGIGSLYGSNTLGGIVGCFLAGFFLIIALGVKETGYLAACVNILVAIVALRLNREYGKFPLEENNKPQEKITDSTTVKEKTHPAYFFSVILFIYALSGFCALAYEVLWMRVLVFFVHNTTYAFTIMLTSFLLGSALGSLLFAKFIDRIKNHLSLLAFIETLIGLFAILSIWEFSKLYNLSNYFLKIFGNSWVANIGIRYIISLLIMFIPTLLMGMAFPLVSKIYTLNIKKLGYSIGNIYAANTLGCVLGSFSAGFILVPLIGISKGIMLIAVINLILGLTVLFFSSLMGYKHKYSPVTVGSFIVGTIVLMHISPQSTFQLLWPGEKLIYYKEATSATVAVVQKTNWTKELSLNGIREVPTDYSSLRTFHMLGQLPCLLHKNPKNALIICFGGGITSGALTRHPLEKIDIVEIAPEVIEANRYFLKENQNVLADPRVNLIIEDGRNHLLSNNAKYDVITCDSTHPIASDSYILYTREFYELCRKRLNPEGIMCQWLPIHILPNQEHKRIIRTFQTVFPETSLWYTNDRFTMLIGMKGNFTIDFSLLLKKLEDNTIKNDLELYSLGNPYTLLSCFVMGKENLARYAQGQGINTDNRPFVQFSKEALLIDTRPINLAAIRKFRERVFPYLSNTGKKSERIKAELDKYFESGTHTILGQIYNFKMLRKQEINEYNKALSINPHDKNAEYLLNLAIGR